METQVQDLVVCAQELLNAIDGRNASSFLAHGDCGTAWCAELYRDARRSGVGVHGSQRPFTPAPGQLPERQQRACSVVLRLSDPRRRIADSRSASIRPLLLLVSLGLRTCRPTRARHTLQRLAQPFRSYLVKPHCPAHTPASHELIAMFSIRRSREFTVRYP